MGFTNPTITFESASDSLGRRAFTIEWLSDGRRRVQCFRADPRVYVTSVLQEHGAVVDPFAPKGRVLTVYRVRPSTIPRTHPKAYSAAGPKNRFGTREEANVLMATLDFDRPLSRGEWLVDEVHQL